MLFMEALVLAFTKSDQVLKFKGHIAVLCGSFWPVLMLHFEIPYSLLNVY